MDRLCLLVAFCFALVGCSAPRPSFDPFAGYGQTRVPPPPTGAVGQPSGYYQPPSYSPPGYSPPGGGYNSPLPPTSSSPPGYTAPGYSAPGSAAPGYPPTGGYPGPTSGSPGSGYSPPAGYPTAPNSGGYPGNYPSGGYSPPNALPPASAYPPAGAYPSPAAGYPSSGSGTGYPGAGYPGAGYPSPNPAYRPPTGLPPFGQNAPYDPLAPRRPASLAARPPASYMPYKPWANNQNNSPATSSGSLLDSTDFEERLSPTPGTSAGNNFQTPSDYGYNPGYASGFDYGSSAESSFNVYRDPRVSSAGFDAPQSLMADEYQASEIDHQQVAPSDWNPYPRDSVAPSPADFAQDRASRAPRIRGFANSGLRPVRIPADVADLSSALGSDNNDWQSRSYAR